MVNQLGLPREALVSVIVREDQALLPRGSTEIEAGDRLHILVRQPVRELRGGPVRAVARGPDRRGRGAASPTLPGRPPIFSVRPWRDEFGDPGNPEDVTGWRWCARCGRGAARPARSFC